METAVVIVDNSVGLVGLSKVNRGFGRGVGRDSEVSVAGQVVVLLVESKRFAIIRGVATTVEGKAIVRR
jgi:hypothetical protein